MGPGVRLVVAQWVPLGGALLCYLIPPRARSPARLVAILCVATAAGLLASELDPVFGGGRVERSLGDVVPGIPFALRADSAGLVVALIACAAAVAAVLEARRLPVERAGLLLCLAGTCLVATAGNLILLFTGLELGNVGALLLTASQPEDGRRPLAGWAVQHCAALGLLAAAIVLQTSAGTSDLSALPESRVNAAVGIPWALAGAVRLLGGLALPGVPGRRASSAWAPVAAAPGGLIVLLRLHSAAGSSGLPRGVAIALVVAGCVAAVAGATAALARHRHCTAAGRSLCVAAAGPVIALVGVGSDAALTAASAAGLTLVLALAVAPAWGAGGDEGAGEAARWIRALALAIAGGLPVGFGTSALVISGGAAAALGLPGSAAAIPLGAAGVLAAVAAAAAVRAVMVAPAPAGRETGPRPDAVLAVAASVGFGLLPGFALTRVVAHLAPGASGTDAVGLSALRGPGGAWAGGYLLVAAVALVTAALSAAVVLGLRPARREPMPQGTLSAMEAVPGRSLTTAATEAMAVRLSQPLRRVDTFLGRAEGWLAGQPGLAMAVAAAVACVVVFR